ncbi:MAG: hypothetical protein WBV76_22110, partial [Pseudolabrys sp.]
VQNHIEALAQLLGMREIYQKTNLRAIGPRSNKSSKPMSALGQKQTFALQKVMSAFPPIADIR